MMIIGSGESLNGVKSNRFFVLRKIGSYFP